MAYTTNSRIASRRAILSAAVALPAIAIGLRVSPAVAAANNSTEWQRLVAAYHRAAAQRDAAEPAVSEADARYRTLVPGEPAKLPFRSAIDHLTVAEIRMTDPDCLRSPENAAYETARAAHQLECGRLYAEIVGEAEATWEAHVDAASEALIALCKFPAPSLAALAEKCEVIRFEYPDAMHLDGQDCAYIMADVRRLAARGA